LKTQASVDSLAIGACQRLGFLPPTDPVLFFLPGRSLARLASSQFATHQLPYAILILFFLFLLSVLSGAEPLSGAEDLLLKGNAAFERNDYEAALSLYRQAEGKIADPSWLAFNEGAALYRLGRYRESEIHYWLSRQDAVGLRQARVLYDLGNSVFRQAGGKDTGLLQRAIGFYEECLANPDTDPELAENARHNLALARDLMKRTKAASPNRPEESNRANKPPEDANPPAPSNLAGSNPGFDDDAGAGQRPGEGSEDRTNSKKSSRQPGIGNLPPVPDSEQLTPLNSEDTSAYLKQAADRILRERRGHYGKSVFRPSQNVKDW